MIICIHDFFNITVLLTNISVHSKIASVHTWLMGNTGLYGASGIYLGTFLIDFAAYRRIVYL